MEFFVMSNMINSYDEALDVNNISEDYDEGLNIVNLLRNILERRTINFPNEIRINDIKVQSVYESFSDDVFCQTITFSAMVE